MQLWPKHSEPRLCEAVKGFLHAWVPAALHCINTKIAAVAPSMLIYERMTLHACRSSMPPLRPSTASSTQALTIQPPSCGRQLQTVALSWMRTPPASLHMQGLAQRRLPALRRSPWPPRAHRRLRLRLRRPRLLPLSGQRGVLHCSSAWRLRCLLQGLCRLHSIRRARARLPSDTIRCQQPLHVAQSLLNSCRQSNQ